MVGVYPLILEWDGLEKDVEVLESGGERRLGASLLDGYEVRIQFADGGLVTIESL